MIKSILIMFYYVGNRLPFQEFMILPVGASTFTEAMRMGAEVYQHLKLVIKEQYGIDATNVGKYKYSHRTQDWTIGCNATC